MLSSYPIIYALTIIDILAVTPLLLARGLLTHGIFPKLQIADDIA